ncbi:cytidine deaminase [Dysgonomonas sp. 511]|uniref:cytidine deaminase n=1 Tax=Dysgonomonas sp. 511 TaxID=2302930 RepID=UPI0013CFE4D3|nr:cytidine deaminase [Dysgonomonas sp. 511]NDV79900.1 cytidine deaminase [Dysgonomonas sp. 511]
MDYLNLTTKILVYSYDEASDSIKKLVDEAKKAIQTSYSPYSDFKVGAAVLLSNGEIVKGSNQENAAYPSGLCAERITLFTANSGYPEMPVEAIAIAAYHDGGFTDAPCTPCGACRQVMLEIENRYKNRIRVIMYGNDKIYEVASVKDLLPLSFGQEALGEKP